MLIGSVLAGGTPIWLYVWSRGDTSSRLEKIANKLRVGLEVRRSPRNVRRSTTHYGTLAESLDLLGVAVQWAVRLSA